MDEQEEKTMEAYFTGTMSSDELRDFETALKANPALQQKLDEFISIKKASASILKDQLRSKLDAINIDGIEAKSIAQQTTNSANASTAKIVRFLKPFLAVAAMFVLGIFTYNNFSKEDTSELFAQHFEVYTPQQARGEERNEDFLKMDTKALDTPEMKLLYSTLKMESNEHAEAIEILNAISDDTAFRDQKYWYLALAQLKLDKKEEAKVTFSKLLSISNYKKKEVTQILESL